METQHGDRVHSSSSAASRAPRFSTTTLSWSARSTIALRLRDETPPAISAANRLFCINSISMSFALDTVNFKKPFGRRKRVFLFERYPTLGINVVPLNFRLTRQSIPLGFLHDGFTLLNLSDWNRINFLVRFFTMGRVFLDFGAISMLSQSTRGRSTGPLAESTRIFRAKHSPGQMT